MSDVDLPDTTPTSPAQLIALLQSLNETLSSTEAKEWSSRQMALQTLTTLTKTISSSLHLTLVQQLNQTPINEQLLDNRSLITGPATEFIVALSTALYSQSGTTLLLEKWFPSVLKLCQSGIKLMSRQGVKCCALLFRSEYHRLLPLVTQKNDHPKTRLACVSALTVAVRLWKNVTLEQVKKAVEWAICDRDPDCREEGRRVYVACEGRWGLNLDLDRSVRKSVERMRKDVEAGWAEGGGVYKNLRLKELNVLKIFGLNRSENNKSFDTKKGVLKNRNVNSFRQQAKSGSLTKRRFWGDDAVALPNETNKTKKSNENREVASYMEEFNITNDNMLLRSPTADESLLVSPDVKRVKHQPETQEHTIYESKDDSSSPSGSPNTNTPTFDSIQSLFKTESKTLGENMIYSPTSDASTNSSTPNIEDTRVCLKMECQTPDVNMIASLFTPKNNFKGPLHQTPTPATSSNPLPDETASRILALPSPVEQSKPRPPLPMPPSDKLALVTSTTMMTPPRPPRANRPVVPNSPGDIISYMSYLPLPKNMMSEDTVISKLRYDSNEKESGVKGLLVLLRNGELEKADDMLDCIIDATKRIQENSSQDMDVSFSEDNKLELLYYQSLKTLLKYQPQLLEKSLSKVLNFLLQNIAQCPFEIRHVIERTLTLIVKKTNNPSKILPHLLTSLSSYNPSSSYFISLRLFEQLVPRLTPSELSEMLPTIMPGVLMAANSHVVEHRKMAVFSCVALWNQMEDNFEQEWLKKMSEVQTRLVTLYRDKRSRITAH